ncbi:hypothetical protein Avbf_05351 [Armadillidium vulgare]|nr:hypothetical protein Avbf_05351 [Armadillidium vulgare]
MLLREFPSWRSENIMNGSSYSGSDCSSPPTPSASPTHDAYFHQSASTSSSVVASDSIINSNRCVILVKVLCSGVLSVDEFNPWHYYLLSLPPDTHPPLVYRMNEIHRLEDSQGGGRQLVGLSMKLASAAVLQQTAAAAAVVSAATSSSSGCGSGINSLPSSTYSSNSSSFNISNETLPTDTLPTDLSLHIKREDN